MTYNEFKHHCIIREASYKTASIKTVLHIVFDEKHEYYSLGFNSIFRDFFSYEHEFIRDRISTTLSIIENLEEYKVMQYTLTSSDYENLKKDEICKIILSDYATKDGIIKDICLTRILVDGMWVEPLLMVIGQEQRNNFADFPTLRNNNFIWLDTEFQISMIIGKYKSFVINTSLNYPEVMKSFETKLFTNILSFWGKIIELYDKDLILNLPLNESIWDLEL